MFPPGFCREVQILRYVSHVSRVNESCLTCDWGVSREWVSHFSCVSESYLTCDLGFSHVWMSHVSSVNESCLTCERVMSRVWISHVSHMNASCCTCEWGFTCDWVFFQWVMSHVWIRNVIFFWMRNVIFFLFSMSHVSCVNEECDFFSFFNESCLMCEWGMWCANEISHVNASCLMLNEGSHVNASCHTRVSHVTYKRAMSHLSYLTCKWGMWVLCAWGFTWDCIMSHAWMRFHLWMRHVSENKKCVMFEVCELCVHEVSRVTWYMRNIMSHAGLMVHMWMHHVTHEWVMSHMNESCHTCMT